MTDLSQLNYNPDVLNCLANLSNDEVFTPPEMVNQMLDRLPEDLWTNPNAKFLDPVCKSGVFLREIAKRLIDGLKTQIPDLQARLDHIYTQQLYGIAITELTALISRRSLYCSKKANGENSICHEFNDEEGNIFKPQSEHSWEGGKCTECGASQDVYDRLTMENHAYGFIHSQARQQLGLENMQFDVIIGNPPYQLNVGIENKSFAIPIYHKFIQQAKKLKPNYLIMIVPSRWFAGGRGLDEFRDEMLNDKRIKEIHDFPNAADCFPGVEVKGGVNYFLWEKDYQGDCLISTYDKGVLTSKMIRPLREEGVNVFIRDNEGIDIFRKIRAVKEKSFSDLISVQTPFGLLSSFKEYSKMKFNGAIKIYGNQYVGYITKDRVVKNQQWIDKHKIFFPKAIGSGNTKTDRINAIYSEPNSVCTQTYLVIGPFEDKSICENVISYVNTKFFHFILGLKKNTQDAMRGVYEFVPIQDFSKSWSDEELYQKYGLTQNEIEFIEKMVRPMEIENV
ncbi:Eco57I restriction-modification methylase domain-containing protein [Rodentibacter haemolyticus]|uniref:site-specific DNA-methyltransferase (adenine-specific) n=1 Tax=Rodentibacter haemolyticus TaxID=2778911 RepID=A0ABX6UUE3_9PAST|nr:Eco57I restriction-modification methylase domain-containing protein [Rodentibacter haemolyticus]QPB41590.1 Eco57I restriction-modification methylase domain-containing protein [Rodentibacter haemolyticus]